MSKRRGTQQPTGPSLAAFAAGLWIGFVVIAYHLILGSKLGAALGGIVRSSR